MTAVRPVLREVMTIIYFADGAPGELTAGPLDPVLFPAPRKG
jgi:hypothetical protein